MSSETRVRIVVFGLVQGVGFRYAAREFAAACGVSGWVRNLPDGSVEIESQGCPSDVARIAAWANRGPRGGVVERVVVDPRPPDSGETGFTIRR